MVKTIDPCRGVAKLVKALDFDSSMQRFESFLPCQIFNDCGPTAAVFFCSPPAAIIGGSPAAMHHKPFGGFLSQFALPGRAHAG
jgi:hypothetical protein